MIYLGVIAVVCLFLGGILSFTRRYMASTDFRDMISNAVELAKDQAVKEASAPDLEGDTEKD